ncbi:hypothetical protein [Aquimarina sp. AU58]|uniref:hypothetical protein n=1 Tax=Aquimarina sp. AU58 TaxID=1874112 RepID=UPI000D643CB3|nr:hypothetical protein [Aquimarina sp. AU58]
MKKSIFLSVSFVLVSLISIDLNNTFPTTGNVGIGTTTPDQALLAREEDKINQMSEMGGSMYNSKIDFGPLTSYLRHNSSL